ncbi:MAG: cytochrome c [Gemmatimonadota bacterium]|nr:cytochrome c [Gemmatimonadota bacterium]
MYAKMFSNFRGFKGLFAVGATLILAGCPGDHSGGYAKVSAREKPGPIPAIAPDPPPVIAGFGGAAAATPILAAGETPAGVTQAMVEEGQQLFGTVCVACHGPGGAGSAAAPQLSDSQWLNISGSYSEIAALIQSGVPKPKQFAAPMPPLGGGNFNAQQVQALAAYVFALSHQEGT